MPIAAALVLIGARADPRLSSATAREPSLSGLTHTWRSPLVLSSVPCTPAGSWSIAITSPLDTAARLARVIRERSSLIISGAARIDHMLSWVRNCAADMPWSGAR